MVTKFVFKSEENRNCQGKGPDFTGMFLKSKETWWNQFCASSGEVIKLPDVLTDLGFNADKMCEDVPEIRFGFWDPKSEDFTGIDFGMTFNDEGDFILDFNCDYNIVEIPVPNATSAEEKKRCYFWKVYKYSVDISEITLKGWVDWCNELYQIQHGKPRPKNNRIFINPDMTTAMVKGRFWNKDRIEKWLTDHGYSWTQTVETKYQWPVKDTDDVELVDSDAELMASRFWKERPSKTQA